MSHTKPEPGTQLFGRGISLQFDYDWNQSSNVAIHGSVVADNYNHGVFVEGSTVTVEATVVRDTQPNELDGLFGRALIIQDAEDPHVRSDATLRALVLDHNHDAGLFVYGSDVVLEGSLVRQTLPDEAKNVAGRGISIEWGKAGPSDVTVRTSRVEENQDVGVYAENSDLLLEDTVVKGTASRASDGAFGDGVSTFSYFVPVSTTIRRCLVSESSRAGISSFAGDVSVESTRLECNGLDLDGEAFINHAPQITDAGGNSCGCEGEEIACQSRSTGVAAPQPLGPGG